MENLLIYWAFVILKGILRVFRCYFTHILNYLKDYKLSNIVWINSIITVVIKFSIKSIKKEEDGYLIILDNHF